MITPFVIAIIALSAIYFLLVLYFFVGWLRMKKFEAPATLIHKHDVYVSIIIPVRNESEHIKQCLECIFKQDYPSHLYEVIVVDDYSTDPTLRLAREFNRNNLLVLDLMQYLGKQGEYTPNKKKAITLGVKNSRGQLIITTDGDCTMGEKWLSTMVGFYKANNFKFVTGPVFLQPAKNAVGLFQQLDVINMVGIGGATIKNGMPTMSNGANLMYDKQAFYEVEGFKGNTDIPTGDDIFLMHKIKDKYPDGIGFIKSYDACVFSTPEYNFTDFVAQRVRWVSKSSRFSNIKVTLVLVLAYLVNLFVIISAMYAMQFTPYCWLPLAIIGGTKLLMDWIFNIPLTVFFKKGILLLVLPFIDLFHILYVVIIGVLGLSGKYKWKDRQVK
jgi:cellulose synthase/poly-beta-1,6-N-acetylglucosamine synthase-like glycosyltransferase